MLGWIRCIDTFGQHSGAVIQIRSFSPPSPILTDVGWLENLMGREEEACEYSCLFSVLLILLIICAEQIKEGMNCDVYFNISWILK